MWSIIEIGVPDIDNKASNKIGALAVRNRSMSMLSTAYSQPVYMLSPLDPSYAEG